MITGLVFGVLIPIFSLFPANAQEVVNTSGGIYIGGTGCSDFKYIASHNTDKIGLNILRLEVGYTVRIMGCRYRIIGKEEYKSGTTTEVMDKKYTYLQTCKENRNDIFYLYKLIPKLGK